MSSRLNAGPNESGRVGKESFGSVAYFSRFERALKTSAICSNSINQRQILATFCVASLLESLGCGRDEADCCAHSHNWYCTCIVPTKCTMFILHTHSSYCCYTCRCGPTCTINSEESYTVYLKPDIVTKMLNVVTLVVTSWMEIYFNRYNIVCVGVTAAVQ